MGIAHSIGYNTDSRADDTKNRILAAYVRVS